MPLVSFQVNVLGGAGNPPVLLVHVGAPAKVNLSWGFAPGLPMYFGGSNLTTFNGFAVNSDTALEPFFLEVPALTPLYVTHANPVNRLVFMLITY
jgi:hypothetical protein